MTFKRIKTKLTPRRITLIVGAILALGLHAQRSFAEVDVSHATADSTTKTIIAQTLELRDTAVPAKTLDDSGLKQLEDPLSKKPTRVLEGVLSKDELTGHVTLSADKKSLTLYAVNHGKRALIFSGDEALVSSASSTGERALTRNQVVSPPRKSELGNDILQVAVSIVSDGAVPTIYDLKTSYQPDGLAYYGKDQQRRNVTERRFGQRTLFPGESTTGRVYLPDNVTNPTQLTIPIIVHPSGESLGNFVLPVLPQ